MNSSVLRLKITLAALPMSVSMASGLKQKSVKIVTSLDFKVWNCTLPRLCCPFPERRRTFSVNYLQ